MTYAALIAAKPAGLLALAPCVQLALCPDCGEFYRTRFPFYCRESQGMEWEEAQCPTWECVEAREVGK